MKRLEGFNLSILWSRIKRDVEDSVRIDTRTLAVFRVFVGLLIIADLLLRSRNFNYFYTSEGVVPPSLAMRASPDPAFSLYYIWDDPAVTAVLFIIYGLVAVQLVLGYKTRLAVILSFLFVVSLDYRNPLVTSYSDVIFRLLLFWAIFLPLGERWSIDAVHRDREPRESVSNIASAAILLQMVYMYFGNAYHKSTSELWTSGDATPLILGRDEMTFLLGDVVREAPIILQQYGGLSWYYLLLFSWLLIVLDGRKRMALVTAFVLGHAIFAVTVRIGAFAYVAMAGLLPFLQAQFWEDAKAAARHVGIEPSSLVSKLSNLKGAADYFPEARLDSARWMKSKSVLYTGALVLVVVSYVLFPIFAYSVVGNVVDNDLSPDNEIKSVASTFGVQQERWRIFSPSPDTIDKYYVFVAKTAENDYLDLYNNRSLTYDRPYRKLQRQHGTYRERFYMRRMQQGVWKTKYDGAPSILAEYLCEKWEEEQGVEVTHINMWHVGEEVTMDTIDSPEERKRNISQFYRHGCGNRETEEIRPPKNKSS